MSDEKKVRTEQAHNPEHTINIVDDISTKGYNPNPLLQVVSQLTPSPNAAPPSEPTPNPPAHNASGGEGSSSE